MYADIAAARRPSSQERDSNIRDIPTNLERLVPIVPETTKTIDVISTPPETSKSVKQPPPRRGRSPRRREETQKAEKEPQATPRVVEDSRTYPVTKQALIDTLKVDQKERGRSQSPMWTPGSTTYAEILRGQYRLNQTPTEVEERLEQPVRIHLREPKEQESAQEVIKQPSPAREPYPKEHEYYSNYEHTAANVPATYATEKANEEWTNAASLQYQQRYGYNVAAVPENRPAQAGFYQQQTAQSIPPPGMFEYVQPIPDLVGFIASGQQLMNSGLGTYQAPAQYTNTTTHVFSDQYSETYDVRQYQDNYITQQSTISDVPRPVQNIHIESATYERVEPRIEVEEPQKQLPSDKPKPPEQPVVSSQYSYAQILSQGLSNKPLQPSSQATMLSNTNRSQIPRGTSPAHSITSMPKEDKRPQRTESQQTRRQRKDPKRVPDVVPRQHKKLTTKEKRYGRIEITPDDYAQESSYQGEPIFESMGGGESQEQIVNNKDLSVDKDSADIPQDTDKKPKEQKSKKQKVIKSNEDEIAKAIKEIERSDKKKRRTTKSSESDNNSEQIEEESKKKQRKSPVKHITVVKETEKIVTNLDKTEDSILTGKSKKKKGKQTIVEEKKTKIIIESDAPPSEEDVESLKEHLHQISPVSTPETVKPKKKKSKSKKVKPEDVSTQEIELPPQENVADKFETVVSEITVDHNENKIFEQTADTKISEEYSENINVSNTASLIIKETIETTTISDNKESTALTSELIINEQTENDAFINKIDSENKNISDKTIIQSFIDTEQASNVEDFVTTNQEMPKNVTETLEIQTCQLRPARNKKNKITTAVKDSLDKELSSEVSHLESIKENIKPVSEKQTTNKITFITHEEVRLQPVRTLKMSFTETPIDKKDDKGDKDRKGGEDEPSKDDHKTEDGQEKEAKEIQTTETATQDKERTPENDGVSETSIQLSSVDQDLDLINELEIEQVIFGSVKKRPEKKVYSQTETEFTETETKNTCHIVTEEEKQEMKRLEEKLKKKKHREALPLDLFINLEGTHDQPTPDVELTAADVKLSSEVSLSRLESVVDQEINNIQDVMDVLEKKYVSKIKSEVKELETSDITMHNEEGANKNKCKEDLENTSKGKLDIEKVPEDEAAKKSKPKKKKGKKETQKDKVELQDAPKLETEHQKIVPKNETLAVTETSPLAAEDQEGIGKRKKKHQKKHAKLENINIDQTHEEQTDTQEVVSAVEETALTPVSPEVQTLEEMTDPIAEILKSKKKKNKKKGQKTDITESEEHVIPESSAVDQPEQNETEAEPSKKSRKKNKKKEENIIIDSVEIKAEATSECAVVKPDGDEHKKESLINTTEVEVEVTPVSLSVVDKSDNIRQKENITFETEPSRKSKKKNKKKAQENVSGVTQITEEVVENVTVTNISDKLPEKQKEETFIESLPSLTDTKTKKSKKKNKKPKEINVPETAICNESEQLRSDTTDIDITKVEAIKTEIEAHTKEPDTQQDVAEIQVTEPIKPVIPENIDDAFEISKKPTRKKKSKSVSFEEKPYVINIDPQADVFTDEPLMSVDHYEEFGTFSSNEFTTSTEDFIKIEQEQTKEQNVAEPLKPAYKGPPIDESTDAWVDLLDEPVVIADEGNDKVPSSAETDKALEEQIKEAVPEKPQEKTAYKGLPIDDTSNLWVDVLDDTVQFSFDEDVQNKTFDTTVNTEQPTNREVEMKNVEDTKANVTKLQEPELITKTDEKVNYKGLPIDETTNLWIDVLDENVAFSFDDDVKDTIETTVIDTVADTVEVKNIEPVTDIKVEAPQTNIEMQEEKKGDKTQEKTVYKGLPIDESSNLWIDVLDEDIEFSFDDDAQDTAQTNVTESVTETAENKNIEPVPDGAKKSIENVPQIVESTRKIEENITTDTEIQEVEKRDVIQEKTAYKGLPIDESSNLWIDVLDEGAEMQFDDDVENTSDVKSKELITEITEDIRSDINVTQEIKESKDSEEVSKFIDTVTVEIKEQRVPEDAEKVDVDVTETIKEKAAYKGLPIDESSNLWLDVLDDSVEFSFEDDIPAISEGATEQNKIQHSTLTEETDTPATSVVTETEVSTVDMNKSIAVQQLDLHTGGGDAEISAENAAKEIKPENQLVTTTTSSETQLIEYGDNLEKEIKQVEHQPQDVSKETNVLIDETGLDFLEHAPHFDYQLIKDAEKLYYESLRLKQPKESPDKIKKLKKVEDIFPERLNLDTVTTDEIFKLADSLSQETKPDTWVVEENIEITQCEAPTKTITEEINAVVPDDSEIKYLGLLSEVPKYDLPRMLDAECNWYEVNSNKSKLQLTEELSIEEKKEDKVVESPVLIKNEATVEPSIESVTEVGVAISQELEILKKIEESFAHKSEEESIKLGFLDEIPHYDISRLLKAENDWYENKCLDAAKVAVKENENEKEDTNRVEEIADKPIETVVLVESVNEAENREDIKDDIKLETAKEVDTKETRETTFIEQQHAEIPELTEAVIDTEPPKDTEPVDSKQIELVETAAPIECVKSKLVEEIITLHSSEKIEIAETAPEKVIEAEADLISEPHVSEYLTTETVTMPDSEEISEVEKIEIPPPLTSEKVEIVQAEIPEDTKVTAESIDSTDIPQEEVVKTGSSQFEDIIKIASEFVPKSETSNLNPDAAVFVPTVKQDYSQYTDVCSEVDSVVNPPETDQLWTYDPEYHPEISSDQIIDDTKLVAAPVSWSDAVAANLSFIENERQSSERQVLSETPTEAALVTEEGIFTPAVIVEEIKTEVTDVQEVKETPELISETVEKQIFKEEQLISSNVDTEEKLALPKASKKEKKKKSKSPKRKLSKTRIEPEKVEEKEDIKEITPPNVWQALQNADGKTYAEVVAANVSPGDIPQITPVEIVEQQTITSVDIKITEPVPQIEEDIEKPELKRSKSSKKKKTSRTLSKSPIRTEEDVSYCATSQESSQPTNEENVKFYDFAVPETQPTHVEDELEAQQKTYAKILAAAKSDLDQQPVVVEIVKHRDRKEPSPVKIQIEVVGEQQTDYEPAPVDAEGFMSVVTKKDKRMRSRSRSKSANRDNSAPETSTKRKGKRQQEKEGALESEFVVQQIADKEKEIIETVSQETPTKSWANIVGSGKDASQNLILSETYEAKEPIEETSKSVEVTEILSPTNETSEKKPEKGSDKKQKKKSKKPEKSSPISNILSSVKKALSGSKNDLTEKENAETEKEESKKKKNKKHKKQNVSGASDADQEEKAPQEISKFEELPESQIERIEDDEIVWTEPNIELQEAKTVVQEQSVDAHSGNEENENLSVSAVQEIISEIQTESEPVVQEKEDSFLSNLLSKVSRSKSVEKENKKDTKEHTTHDENQGEEKKREDTQSKKKKKNKKQNKAEALSVEEKTTDDQASKDERRKSGVFETIASKFSEILSPKNKRESLQKETTPLVQTATQETHHQSAEQSLAENLKLDGPFWLSKSLYEDAENIWIEKLSEASKTGTTTENAVVSDSKPDRDQDPDSSSGRGSPTSEPDNKGQSNGNADGFNNQYTSADLPGGIAGWQDQSTYLTLQSEATENISTEIPDTEKTVMIADQFLVAEKEHSSLLKDFQESKANQEPEITQVTEESAIEQEETSVNQENSVSVEVNSNPCDEIVKTNGIDADLFAAKELSESVAVNVIGDFDDTVPSELPPPPQSQSLGPHMQQKTGESTSEMQRRTLDADEELKKVKCWVL